MRCKNNCFICKLQILLSKTIFSMVCYKKSRVESGKVESYDYLC